MADATVLRLGGKNVKDVAGLRADPAAGRQPGDARADHRGDAPPPAGAAAARDDARVLPLARGGRRGRRRADRGGARAGDPRADGPVHDPGRGRRPQARASTGTPPRCCSSSRTCPAGRRRARSTRPSRSATAAGATLVVRAADPQEADWLRQGRRLAFRALEHLGVARMEDVGVPRSRVPEMLREIEAIGERHRLTHRDVRARRRRQPPPDVRAGPGRGRGGGRAAARGRARTTCTRRPSRSAGRSRASTGSAWRGATGSCASAARTRSAVMRAIKHALDPQDLLNPGRVLA